ncbi:MAG: hypothetical protein Q8R26_00615 [bacterium]|nr:hypothetical protein [bacterium]
MLRVFKLFVLLAGLNFLATPVWGQEYKFNGFVSWKYDNHNSNKHKGVPLQHAWLIGNKKMSENWDVTVIVAPYGPPRVLHDLRFQWLKPKPFVERIALGRFQPPVGRELADVRVDRLSTIAYSSMADSMVVRDDGVKVDLKFGKFLMSIAGFLGNRVGGFKEEIENGCPDFYFRTRILLGKNLQIGWSYRLKHKDHRLWSAEASRKTSKTLLAFETTGYNFGKRWYGLGELQFFKKLRAALRYENLESFNGSGRRHRWILGAVMYLPHDNEVRLNRIHDLYGRKIYSVQAILRW